MLHAPGEKPGNQQDQILLVAEKEAFSRLAQGQGLAVALTSLLNAVERLAGEDLITSVWTIDSAKALISFCAGPRVPAAYRDAAHNTPLDPNGGSCGRAVTLKQPIIVPDVSVSPLWAHCADLLKRVGIRASWSTPILSSAEKVLGTFAVYYQQPGQPPVEHLHLINRVTQTAALLIERDRHEGLLQAREEQLQLISNNLPALISYVDIEGRYVFCNERYREWFGLPVDRIIGQHIGDVVGQEAWKIIGPRFQTALTGEAIEYEAEVSYSRGGQRWIHAVYLPHRDREGQIKGIVVHVSDISERKQLEQAVKETDDRIRQYFKLGLIGSAITSPSKGWIEVNDELCRILGYERHELLQMTWADLTHPDDLSADLQQFDRVLAGEMDGYSLDKRFIRKDGQVVDTIISVKCLRHPNGSVEYFLAMVQDITQRKQAEVALRESEDRYRGLVKMMPVGMYTCDQSGRITFYNDHATRVWGRVPDLDDDNLRFCGSYKIFLPDGSPVSYDQTPVAMALQKGLSYRNQEAMIEQPDGTRRTVLVNIDPLLSDDTITGAVNVFTDITERKQTEAALRESEERLRLALEGGNIGMWSMDLVSGMMDCTPLHQELLGLEPLKRRFSMEEWLSLIHPEDKQLVMCALSNSKGNGVSSAVEYRITRPDGTLRWMDSRWQCQRAEINLPVSIIGITMDITGRREREMALGASEERLQLALIAGGMGSWDYEISTGCVTWDHRQYELFGRSIHEALTTMEQFYQLLHPDDVPRIQERAQRAEQEGHFSEEFRIIHPDDGTVHWLAGHGVVMSNQNGQSCRLVGVNYDITHQKETQELLERRVAERTKDLLQSQHQLRALATELHLTEQRERKRLATELHDHLQQLLVLSKLKLDQAKRLTETSPACAEILKQTEDIITEAFSYTRTLVAELSPPVLREHGLAASLKWLGEHMKQHELRVAVTVPKDEELALSEDQAILLFQSIRELLLNASKHAGTQQASVLLEATSTQLRLEVHDEGVGFDPLAVNQAEETSSLFSSKFGLYSIRERMKALGGAFDLTSAPGKGTTVTLTLPRKLLPPSPERNIPTEKRVGVPELPFLQTSRQGIIRVLVVDDHAMMRQGLRSVLESYADIEVVGEAVDGEDAVRRVEELHPHVVVMDLNMPKMDGITATRRIRAQFSGINIVGISVNASKENQEALKGAGASALLTKELAVKELYLAIKEAILSAPER